MHNPIARCLHVKISKIKHKNPPTDDQMFNVNDSNDKAFKLTSQKDKLRMHPNRKLSNDEASKLAPLRDKLRTHPNWTL